MTKSLSSPIHKLLNLICDRDITKSTLNQVNYILITFCRIVIEQCLQLLENVNKPMLNLKTLINSLRLLFTGETLRGMASMIEDTKETYIPRYFIKNLTKEIRPTIKIAKKFNLGLATIIEYLCINILELSSFQTMKERRVRITTRDLYLGIHHDKELSTLFKVHKIMIINGGVVPLSGSKIQKGNNLLIPKLPFCNMIRYICKDIEGTDVKISKDTFTLLQYCIETYVVDFIRKAKRITSLHGRTKMVETDMMSVSILS